MNVTLEFADVGQADGVSKVGDSFNRFLVHALLAKRVGEDNRRHSSFDEALSGFASSLGPRSLHS